MALKVLGVLDVVGLVGGLDDDGEAGHEVVRRDVGRAGDAECVPEKRMLPCRRGTRRVSARRVEPDVVRHGVGSSVRTGVVLIQIDTTKLTRGL